jgi:hypothetical protein
MSEKELIAAVERGERISTEHSFHSVEKDCGPHICSPRCIACDGDRDAYECRTCGKQWTGRCDFDEEYS